MKRDTNSRDTDAGRRDAALTMMIQALALLDLTDDGGMPAIHLSMAVEALREQVTSDTDLMDLSEIA